MRSTSVVTILGSLLLGSCAPGAAGDLHEPATFPGFDEEDLQDLDVELVEPDYGTNAGGSEVVIWGGPFEGLPEVRFGNSQAEVLDVDETKLRVRVPGSPFEGLVPVRVRTETHAGTLPEGFRYWRDGQGQIGAVGAIEHHAWIGEYWEDLLSGTPSDQSGAWMYFHPPTDRTIGELLYAPGMNSCRSNYQYEDVVSAYDPEAAQLWFRAGTGSLFALSPHPQSTWWYERQLSFFPAGTEIDLDPVQGKADWPDAAVPNIARTPSPFQITDPDLHGQTVPTVSRYDFTLEWDEPGAGTYMFAHFYRYEGGSIDGQVATVAEQLTCVMEDTGSFTVPSTAWSGWLEDEQITVELGRVVDKGSELPHNRARSNVVGIYWLIGAVYSG